MDSAIFYGVPARLYPQLELLNTWAIDRTRFSPDATKPPLCLRCGQPLSPVLSHNALSRYADVHICAACGMNEAMGDATQTQKRFLNWAAVAEHWLKAPAENDAWVVQPTCPFFEIYLDTSVNQLGHKSPKMELAYAAPTTMVEDGGQPGLRCARTSKCRTGQQRSTSLWTLCFPCRRWHPWRPCAGCAGFTRSRHLIPQNSISIVILTISMFGCS